MQHTLLKQQNPNSRIASLLGKILLQHGLALLQPAGTYTLAQIQFTYYHRPYLPESNIDFNLSHSGKYVICALSDTTRLGIDIEQIKPVNMDHFTDFMTPEEIEAINAAPEPVIAFYKYWTQKESILKANGKGLHIPLNEFSVADNQATLENQHWYIQELSVDEAYICHIATNTPSPVISIQYQQL